METFGALHQPYNNEPPLALTYAQFRKLLDDTVDHHDVIKNAEQYEASLAEIEVMFDYVKSKHPGSIAERNHYRRIMKVLSEHNSKSSKEPPRVAHQVPTDEEMED